MLSFFIQHAPVPVALFDTQMRHIVVSEAWQKTFRLGEPNTFIGKSHYAVYPNQRKECREQHQQALRGETVHGSTKMTAEFKDDVHQEPMWLDDYMHPWYTPDQSIGGIIIYVTVVTDQINMHNHLVKTVHDLRSVNQKLEHLVYGSAHDLKEPLRTMINFMTLLFNRYQLHFDDEERFYMEVIRKSGDQMQALINSILLYASPSTHELIDEKRALDMNALVCEIKDMFVPRFADIGGQLILGNLPIIVGVGSQMRQLFTNLVSNALKFRSERSLVGDIYAVEQEHAWTFHVRDNGIGIDEVYHSRIFTMFTRLHSRQTYEGSGIGLALCQKIVHDHLGTIAVTSIPGEGSDFVVTLPKMEVEGVNA